MDWITLVLIPLLILILPLSFTFYKWKVERNDRLLTEKENNDLKKEIDDLSENIKLDFEIFNDIKNVVDSMFDNTKADRFLILTASNGKTHMDFVSVIYEHHKKSNKAALSIGATSKYVQFEFDNNYRSMLKLIEASGEPLLLDVDDMRDGDLKLIYESEKVTHSIVYFLNRVAINEYKDRLFFCSIATHSDDEFTDTEYVQIKSSVSAIKSKIKKMII